jgi:hypothetical protein
MNILAPLQKLFKVPSFLIFTFLLSISPTSILAENTCPAESLDGKGCSTITDEAMCASYFMVGTDGKPNIACSWNGSYCSDGGGDCTGGGANQSPPPCPATSLGNSGCSTITDSDTCGTYYMPGSNGESPIACWWSNGSCSDGGGFCTVTAQPSSSKDCTGSSAGWNVFNNGNNYEGHSEICGSQPSSGNKSIGEWDTQTWTSYAPNGSGVTGWEWWDGCSYVSDGNWVTVADTGNMTINPWSATATNWDVTSSHSWSSGALWGYGMLTNSYGNGDWIWVGSQGFTNNTWVNGSVYLFDHGCSSSGTMTMLNWSSSNVNASSASSMTSDGKVNLRANRPENLNSGVDGSKGYNHQHVGHYRISELTAKLPEDFQGGQVPGLAALCPEGFMPMNSSVLSDVANGKALSILTNFGATVSAPKKMAGAELTSQLVCLKQGLPAYYSGGQYWGSYEGDVVKTRAKGRHFFTGPGNDKVSATGNSSQVYGGLGDDLLTVRGRDSVAVGGPGNDVVRALGKARVKIDGGIGADTLIGNKGLTIIVALDGAADDVVQCVGRRNVAVIDVGDKVMGKCASVITPNAQ